MKRLSVLVAILLLLLCGCKSTNKLFDIDYKTYSPENIKITTEKENYSKNDTVIRYSITNISDGEQCVNSDDNCFSLHKLVDGEWKWVGTKIEHCWTSMGLILPAGGTENREINLGEYYNLPLDKGTYRICIESLLSNTFEIS